MLYINLDDKQMHTAYQALNERVNIFVPLRLPQFSRDEFVRFMDLSFAEATTKILNLFFGSSVDSAAIEACLKENVLLPEALDRKTLLIKIRKDDDHGFKSLVNSISGQFSSDPLQHYCWINVAIGIGLLFGLAADLNRCGIRSFDFAIHSNDLKDLLPVVYAKQMGIPVNKIICGCLREEGLWKLLHDGSIRSLDDHLVKELVYGYTFNADSAPDDELLLKITNDVFTSVISQKRSAELVVNVLNTYGKVIDSHASVAYGALQDYRASAGENNITIIFSEE